MIKKIKIVLFLSLLVIYSSSIFCEKVLLELESKPYFIKIYDGLIYVSEISKLNVYNLKNYKIAYTIGRKGEGPGEFTDVPVPQAVNGKLIVSSDRKILFFNKKGQFLKERKIGTGGSSLKKFYNEEKYFGIDIVRNPKNYEVCYNLYNKLFIKKKKIYSFDWMIKKNRKKDLFEVHFYDAIKKNMVFAHADKFIIDIIDSNGNLKKRIEHNKERIKFTEKNKKRVLQFWKNDIRYRKNYKFVEKRTIFPKYFPYIATCRVSGDKIYVITYLKKDGKSECIKFSMKGDLLDTHFIDLKTPSPFFSDLIFDIYNDQLFQLMDNSEKEVWEMYVSKIR